MIFDRNNFRARFGRYVNDGLSIHKVDKTKRPKIRELLRRKPGAVQEAIEAEFFKHHDAGATLAELWQWIRDNWETVLKILLSLLLLILDEDEGVSA